MKQIIVFDVSRLRTEEVFGFHQQITNLAVNNLTQENDKPMVDAYCAPVHKLDVSLKQNVKNSQTAIVAARDEHFDKRYVATSGFIRMLPMHPDPDVAAIGVEALAIVDKYGNITKLPYNQEYGSAHNFLQDIAALGTEKLTISGLLPWYESLQEAYDWFIAAREGQVLEESTKIVGIIKESREAADAAYRNFIQTVNAKVIVFGEENYASFIDQANVVIANANATLKARSTRSENAKKENPNNTEDMDDATEDSEVAEV